MTTDLPARVAELEKALRNCLEWARGDGDAETMLENIFKECERALGNSAAHGGCVEMEVIEAADLLIRESSVAKSPCMGHRAVTVPDKVWRAFKASMARAALAGTGDDVLADRGANELVMAYALRDFIYETTHLSPREDDGSHKCRISAATLAKGREALDAFEWQDIHDAGGILQEERAELLATEMRIYENLRGTLLAAKKQLIVLGGDECLTDPNGDHIQAAILRMIDKAMTWDGK